MMNNKACYHKYLSYNSTIYHGMGTQSCNLNCNAPQYCSIYVNNKIRLVSFLNNILNAELRPVFELKNIHEQEKKNNSKITSLRDTIEYTETRMKAMSSETAIRCTEQTEIL
jgi:hypothetical protein